MSEFVSWRDVKSKIRDLDPSWDSEERVARRGRMRQEAVAAVNGAKLAEIRKGMGLTQTQLARATGLSQARISQIEHGEVVSLDVLRTYIGGLGGQVDVVVRIGDVRLSVA